ncbi:MAG: hypothetical protein ACJAXY_000187 [Nonlabens sp.]|jgi:hypothetical protein
MNKAADKTTKIGWYPWDECTDVCTDALDAAGLNNGEWNNYDPINDPIEKFKVPFIDKNVSSNNKQRQIEEDNKGTDVDNKLKPTIG